MGQILVGVDGSQGASHALQWAVAEADLRGASVTAVLAWGLLDQHHADGTERFDSDYGTAEAEAAIAAVIERSVGPERGASIERLAICDRPAPALLSAATDAELLVVGARGMGGFKGLLLGSVSQSVLHHAEVPVAVVRDGSAANGGGVVVGVDGSDTSQRALALGIDEAALRSTTLTAVNAWQAPIGGAFPEASLAISPADMERTANEIIADALAEVDTTELDAPPTAGVHLGGAAEAILKFGENADLIVVGSRGRGGFTGLLLGSVTMQVTQHANSTVIVVPAQG